MDLAVVGFWIGLLVPAISYVVYPIGMVVAGRIRSGPPLDESRPWPSVTIAIAAHNEEVTIARAVASALGQDYPGPPVTVMVGLDGCTDSTAAVLATIADRRLRVLDLPRAGKATTDNRLVEAADTEVVVTTSAGSEFAPGTLAALVAPLRDPVVGCVTGIFRPRPDGTISGEGEGIYWRLEYAVMSAESRLGVLAMASGTALAFRRRAFRPIPADSDADVVVAPNAVLAGFRVVHEPSAVVYDDGPPSLRAVLRNRRRMALRALPATLGLIPRLVGARRGAAAASLLAHKVFRWLTPAAALVWLLSAPALLARAASPYRLLVVGLLAVGSAVGVAGIATPRTRGAVASLAVAQVAFGLALVDAARGRRARTWTRDAA